MYLLPERFHEKDTYTNKGIAYLFNDSIYEYDMHSAGLNLLKYYKIIPEEKIEMLQKLDKKSLNRKIGILQRNDPSVKQQLKKAFADARKMFYQENALEPNDIIAVKKDAIFTRKFCENSVFGNITFVVKNQYSSFVQVKNLEIYYNGKIDVKGIDDELLALHENGIYEFLMKFFRRVETQEKASVYSFLNKYATSYKLRELSVDHYRQFNASSSYVVTGSEDIYMEYWDYRKEDLDISYNWNNVIIPLILMMY